VEGAGFRVEGSGFGRYDLARLRRGFDFGGDAD